MRLRILLGSSRAERARPPVTPALVQLVRTSRKNEMFSVPDPDRDVFLTFLAHNKFRNLVIFLLLLIRNPVEVQDYKVQRNNAW